MLTPFHQRRAVAALVLVVAALPAVGRAQAPAANRPATLQPLLGRIVWDAAQRGPLLIVAPDKTTPRWSQLPGRAVSAESRGPLTIPAPDANGNYRLADLGDYFGRRVVPVGKTLSVFAPTTMAVLATRLPQPDPYAGLGMNEKLRLFQSTLTPAEWRAMGSPEGIGIGDLDKRQRGIFLSLLPDPFVVQPVKHDASGQRVFYYDPRPETGVTLTPAQRQSARLSLRRVMGWSFLPAGSGDPNRRMSVAAPGDEDGASYALRGLGFGSNSLGGNGLLFGARLVDEAPNRPKPGQLPFDWSALDVPVPLDNAAATVGDLVRRAAARAHVELFCDPRYADLTVVTRGGGASVRAGDLLKALSLAVTGTFRRVGASTFVMTDDIEGLGSRHARLEAWAQANAALAEQARARVDEALARTPVGDYVGWSENDPLRPVGALAGKIEEHIKKAAAAAADPNAARVASSPAQRAAQALIVPVLELSPAQQETVRRQLENNAREAEQRKNDPFFIAHPEFFPPLQGDRVVIDVQMRASFVVPGLGAVSSQGYSISSDAEQSLTLGRRGIFPPATLEPPKPTAIPDAYVTRALLVAPQNADEAAQAVAAAKAHGLNQVWIETDNAATLTAGVAGGKKANIGVGAVVRVLRAPVGASLAFDRNIVGETATEFAARRAGAPFVRTPFNSGALTPAQEAEVAARAGNWLVPDGNAVQAAALKRAAQIAAIPGLTGVILSDVAAPGYDGARAGSPFDFMDGAEQMGYTEPMRLAFLREASVDPLDLSPLRDGRLVLPPAAYSDMFNDGMTLPFFPDYGPDPAPDRINNRSALELGAKDSAPRWARFRKSRSDALADSVVRAVRAGNPKVTVWTQRGAESPWTPVPWWSFFDIEGAPAAVVAGAPARGGDNGPPRSAHAALRLRCAPLTTAGPDAGPDPAAEFTRQLAALMGRGALPGWEGVVIDLSDAPLGRALPLLDILRP